MPMRLRRHLRIRLLLVALACLLSQQAAMAAHACMATRAPAQPVPMAQHCASQPTDEMPDTASLCIKHCTPDEATSGGPAGLSVPALLLPPVRFEVMAPVAGTGLFAWREVPLARSDPPLRLRYCTLLI